MAPEVARGFKSRGSILKAEGEGGLEGSPGNVVVLDQVLGRLAIEGFWNAPQHDLIRNQFGMTFREIPGGTFTMGGNSNDEKPQHTVNLPGFWLGTTTVTQAQWRAVMGNSPSKFSGDDGPVEHVNWEDARRFIAALNATEPDRSYRLPSEAEWEYACRAGSTGDTYGDLDAIAWYRSNSGDTTHPVGQKQPNAFGLFDMLGNVWQWCEDNWHDTYQGAPNDGSAWEASNSRRVVRGGSWYDHARNLRSGNHYSYESSHRGDNIGFRVVCVP